MIFKIIAFVAAAVPIFLFVRSMFFRRPARPNEGFKEFKKQSDLAVSIFLLLIGCVVLFSVALNAWPTLPRRPRVPIDRTRKRN
jgi:NADH:ubiquinone oxidoreductase subunit 6 (subunit J)